MLSIEFSRKDKDQSIVEGLKKGRKKTVKEVYEKFYPYVKNHILKNSGSEDDAKDVFQDAMMAIFQNVSNKEFELTCQFKTYIHAVSSNIWNKRLRERKNRPTEIQDEIHDIAQEELEDAVLKIERYRFYVKKFNEISEKCRELLKMYLSGIDMKSIAQHFSFASVSYAKKRKFQCKESLIKLIEKDPEYQLLMAYE